MRKGELKAIQLSPTGQEQLRDPRFNPTYSKVPEHVNIVLTPQVERAPLALEQIPYRPGGHIVYDQSFYASQPKIRGSTYISDINVYGFDTQSLGQRKVAALNEARVMLKEAVATGDYRALEQYLPKNLPHTVADLKGMFHG